MKIALEDADIDKIAAATVALFKAEGGTVNGKDTTKEAAPPKGKDAAPKGGKGKPKVVKADVLAKIRDYGAKTDKDKAKALISEYGENFNAVSDEDLVKLNADVDAALAALEAGEGEEEESF